MKKVFAMVLLSVLAAGCDDDSGGMSTGELATKMATLHCDKFYTCCEDFGGWEFRSYDSYSECLTGEEQKLKRVLESPNVTVNESRLADFYSAYSKLYAVGCEEVPDHSYDDDVEAAQIGMLTGSLAPGGVCIASEECADGYCNWTGDDSGVCVAYPQVGEECDYYGNYACDPSLACNSAVSPALCMEPMKVGDACLTTTYGSNECFGSAVYCVEATMKCAARKATGASCTDDPECLSDYCEEGTCADDFSDSTIVENECTDFYD
ncbi:hypothetical protein KKF84_10410 [Myxococcota bacterium]|nr:hypothetical protein [Myxococcota bacterium]